MLNTQQMAGPGAFSAALAAILCSISSRRSRVATDAFPQNSDNNPDIKKPHPAACCV
ncbi:hypothetical protein HWI77_17390 (plasmid) [Acinetobacter venetianus]|nr:hypothetical protein HWI77_17390 [Acinetobacter venetianus]